jgi:hypothetical protein
LPDRVGSDARIIVHPSPEFNDRRLRPKLADTALPSLATVTQFPSKEFFKRCWLNFSAQVLANGRSASGPEIQASPVRTACLRALFDETREERWDNFLEQ